MFKKQEEALKSLEKAFKKCAAANIVFYGSDGNLYAMDGRKHCIVEDTDGGIGGTIPSIAQNVENIGGWSVFVNTSDTYKDSGGG